MTKASDNEFPSLLFKEGTAPSSPAAGDQRLYLDSADHILKRKNSSGTIKSIESSGAEGDPTGTLNRSYIFTSTIESWTVSAGSISSTGSQLRVDASGGLSNSVAQEPSGASSVADGELEVEVTPVDTGGGGGTEAGLDFRLTDSSNYYLVALRPMSTGGNGIELYKVVAGAFTSLGSNPSRYFGTGAMIKVLVRFVGSQIKCYVNGGLVAAWKDTTYTTGRIGLRGHQGLTDYDNVKVYTLP